MNIEKDVLENKAKIRMLELKIKALINILNKEGVILEEEIEKELNSVIQQDKKGEIE